MVVSDNLKAGITRACFYEPAVNRSYQELATHYRTAIVPARPRKPRDKAKVEAAVIELRKADPKLTREMALRQAYRADPALRAAVEAEEQEQRREAARAH